VDNLEVFTKVKTHLLAQMSRSLGTNLPTCRYRGAEGRKCAIGCLIPDEEYKSVFEIIGLPELVEAVPSLRGTNINLLRALRTLHDYCEPETWSAKLDEIEAKWIM
jgi:hypothetical protein